jgi:hypothetical protein
VSRIAHSPSRNASYRTYSIHITPESHNSGFWRCGVSPGSSRRSGPLDAAHNTIPPRVSTRSVAQIQVFRMTPALLRVVLASRPGRPSVTASPAVPDAPVSLTCWSTGPQRGAHNAWKILLQIAATRHPSIDGCPKRTATRSARPGPRRLRRDGAAASGSWPWLAEAVASPHAVRQVVTPGTT